jgi:hypothetical protein
LQFAGGFIAAIAVGLPTFLKWNRLQRWQLLDGYAVAVLLGAAFGRMGCLAVGEHFGDESDFFLATRWDGAIALPAGEAPLREPTLGPNGPVIEEGVTTFLNPSLYECVTLFVLFGVLALVLRRKPTPGTVGALFLWGYGVQRFLYDTLRVNDERVAGMTGAQWMCLAMIPIGFYVWFRVRPAMAKALAAGEVGGTPVGPTAFARTGKVPPPRKKGGADDATDEDGTDREVDASDEQPDDNGEDVASGADPSATEGATEEPAPAVPELPKRRPSAGRAAQDRDAAPMPSGNPAPHSPGTSGPNDPTAH